MSKRSNFEKVPRDKYYTKDPRALPPKFLGFIQGKTYAEPCFGAGDLIKLIGDNAQCKWASDLEPDNFCVPQLDGLDVTSENLKDCELIITNPPYTRRVLLPLIDHFVRLKPTWLLLPADYMHNKYFGEYIQRCSKVVSIGRLTWFEGHSSTDNYAWYFWPKGVTEDQTTVFYGRD